jgi:hypothetical protein
MKIIENPKLSSTINVEEANKNRIQNAIANITAYKQA